MTAGCIFIRARVSQQSSVILACHCVWDRKQILFMDMKFLGIHCVTLWSTGKWRSQFRQVQFWLGIWHLLNLRCIVARLCSRTEPTSGFCLHLDPHLDVSNLFFDSFQTCEPSSSAFGSLRLVLLLHRSLRLFAVIPVQQTGASWGGIISVGINVSPCWEIRDDGWGILQKLTTDSLQLPGPLIQSQGIALSGQILVIRIQPSEGEQSAKFDFGATETCWGVWRRDGDGQCFADSLDLAPTSVYLWSVHPVLTQDFFQNRSRHFFSVVYPSWEPTVSLGLDEEGRSERSSSSISSGWRKMRLHISSISRQFQKWHNAHISAIFHLNNFPTCQWNTGLFWRETSLSNLTLHILRELKSLFAFWHQIPVVFNQHTLWVCLWSGKHTDVTESNCSTCHRTPNNCSVLW